MQYTSYYKSPLGNILLACDESGLTGLWFEGQKYFATSLQSNHEAKETSILTQAKRFLDIYFSGNEPDFKPPVHLEGTKFQKKVWEILCSIPYGKTLTYGEIAKKLAKIRNTPHMSAQAVGGAVSRNPISVIVPCHRVVGAKGSMTGYAGGISKKIELLRLEKAVI